MMEPFSSIDAFIRVSDGYSVLIAPNRMSAPR
jgi:hypothetical protein